MRLTVALMVASFALGGAVGAEGPFSQTTAIWIQAIGTIAAVASAPFIALATERRRRNEERRHVAQVVVAAVEQNYRDVQLRLRPAIESMEDELLDAGLKRADQPEALALTGLLKLPMTQWPSPGLFATAQAYLENYQGLVRACELVFHPDGDGSYVLPKYFLEALKHALRAVQFAAERAVVTE